MTEAMPKVAVEFYTKYIGNTKNVAGLCKTMHVNRLRGSNVVTKRKETACAVG